MVHKVTLALNTNVVINKDVEFTIKHDGRTLGRLLISKGNLEWLPAGNKKTGFRFLWADFDDLVKIHGKKVTVRNARARKPVKKAVVKKIASKRTAVKKSTKPKDSDD